MAETSHLHESARIYGWLWIAISPLLAGMALVSTMASETAYYMQLLAFGSVAVAGLTGGLGTILRRAWGARLLLALSWLGCVYWFGSALAAVGFAVAAGKAPVHVIVGIAVMIGLPGVAFMLIASGIRKKLASVGTSPD